MFKINSIALTAALCGFSNYADAQAPGCHPAYSGGAAYSAGDTVSATSTVDTTTSCTCSAVGCPTAAGQTTGCEVTTTTTETHNYSCVSGANSAFCSQSGFEPTGQFSSIAWTKDSVECSVSSNRTARSSLSMLSSTSLNIVFNHPGSSRHHSRAHPGRLADRLRLPGRLRLRRGLRAHRQGLRRWRDPHGGLRVRGRPEQPVLRQVRLRARHWPVLGDRLDGPRLLLGVDVAHGQPGLHDPHGRRRMPRRVGGWREQVRGERQGLEERTRFPVRCVPLQRILRTDGVRAHAGRRDRVLEGCVDGGRLLQRNHQREYFHSTSFALPTCKLPD